MSRGTSVQIHFSFPFSSKMVVCGHHLMTLSLTINETLKWLSSLPISMQESFWRWHCSDRYVISLFPHLHTLFPPFPPSLISLMLSVDIKHHVYLLKKGLWRWKATEPAMTLWLIISGCGSAVRPVASGAAADWQVDRTWPLPPGAATWLDQHHLPQVSTASGNLLLWTLLEL